MSSSRLYALVSAGLMFSTTAPHPAVAASEAVIYVFKGGSNGHTPYAPLIKVGAKLFGTTYVNVFSLTISGKERNLHTFRGGDNDGLAADSGLTELGGTLYGLTFEGGPGEISATGGTAYSVTPQGAYSILYDFSEVSGYEPSDTLVALGNILYGTTDFGGGGDDIGTAFSLTPQGTLKILHHFSYGDGRPSSGFTNVDGVLYGATSVGGGTSHGTVYRIGTDGTYTVVYSFLSGNDGNNPAGRLVNVSGRLYGTTTFGGSGSCNIGNGFTGCGTIFSVTPQGVESVLYSFPQQASPSSLIYVDGVFYGTTYYGGGTGCGGNGCGTVFAITPQGTYSTLYAFQGGSDGAQPGAPLLDVSGVLYGTTETGGNGKCKKQLGCGTVFEITP